MRNSRNRRRRKYRINYKRISLIVLALILIAIASVLGIKAITNNNRNVDTIVGSNRFRKSRSGKAKRHNHKLSCNRRYYVSQYQFQGSI